MNELYALTIVTEDDPNRIIGETFFVFDTAEMAMDFASTDPKFIGDFEVASMGEWQKSEKWRDAHETTFVERESKWSDIPTRTIKLIVHTIHHNPNYKE